MVAEKGDRTLATPGLLVHSSFVIYKLAAAIIIAANNRALRTYSRRVATLCSVCCVEQRGTWHEIRKQKLFFICILLRFVYIYARWSPRIISVTYKSGNTRSSTARLIKPMLFYTCLVYAWVSCRLYQLCTCILMNSCSIFQSLLRLALQRKIT